MGNVLWRCWKATSLCSQILYTVNPFDTQATIEKHLRRCKKKNWTTIFIIKSIIKILKEKKKKSILKSSISNSNLKLFAFKLSFFSHSNCVIYIYTHIFKEQFLSSYQFPFSKYHLRFIFLQIKRALCSFVQYVYTLKTFSTIFWG